MVDFERTKAFSRKFAGVVLDEYDLKRLAEIIRNNPPSTDISISIVIESGDGEETIRTEDADFFISLDMPKQIRSISMFRFKPNFIQECYLRLAAFPLGDISFDITSSDVNSALGLSHELERQLRQKTLRNPRFVRNLHEHAIVQTMLVTPIYCLIEWATISSLNLITNVLKKNINGFEGSLFQTIFYLASLILIVIFTFIVCMKIIEGVKQVFPILEFSGKLSDPRSHSRSRWVWLLVALVIPLLVGTLASIIANKLS